MNNSIILWHGGRDLEYSYRENHSFKKSRWEHGPGLYLTTHYERASKYAKGGGKTYKVEIEEGNDINNIKIDLLHVNEFINQYIIKSKKAELLDCIYDNVKRMNSGNQICADYFLNLIINMDAITTPKANHLQNFLVSHNVDYSVVNNFGGRNETVLVVFNQEKIKKVKHVSAKDVSLNDWELNFNLNRNRNKMLKM
jgi:hypothetical protein